MLVREDVVPVEALFHCPAGGIPFHLQEFFPMRKFTLSQNGHFSEYKIDTYKVKAIVMYDYT